MSIFEERHGALCLNKTGEIVEKATATKDEIATEKDLNDLRHRAIVQWIIERPGEDFPDELSNDDRWRAIISINDVALKSIAVATAHRSTGGGATGAAAAAGGARSSSTKATKSSAPEKTAVRVEARSILLKEGLYADAAASLEMHGSAASSDESSKSGRSKTSNRAVEDSALALRAAVKGDHWNDHDKGLGIPHAVALYKEKYRNYLQTIMLPLTVKFRELTTDQADEYITAEFQSRLGRDPTEDEITELGSGIAQAIKDVQAMLGIHNHLASLDLNVISPDTLFKIERMINTLIDHCNIELKVLDATTSSELASADIELRRKANEKKREAIEAQRELRRVNFEVLRDAIPPAPAKGLPVVATTKICNLLSISALKSRPRVNLSYSKRVAYWETFPLQRLLTGMTEAGVRGLPYRGTTSDLFIQEVLHSLPREIDPLLRTCLASAYKKLPASQTRFGDDSDEMPGLSMRCHASIMNPWHDFVAPGAAAAAAGAGEEHTPVSTALSNVLAGADPIGILELQLRAALIFPDEAGLTALHAETITERGALDAAIEARTKAARLVAYASAQERLILDRFRTDKATYIREMTKRSSAVAAGGLPATFEIDGEFSMSCPPPKPGESRSQMIVHRYLCEDASIRRPNLEAFQLERSVRISDMGPDAVVNIYTPRVAAGGGGAAGGAAAAAGGAFGIMEIIVRVADRGLTLSFYHTFS